jgi:hypothetical protein
LAVFTRKSILTRIKDLAGDEVTSIEGYKDIINTGFNFIADMIPPNSELWRSSAAKVMSTFLSEFPIVADVRVIMVTRTDDNNVKRVCREVPFDYLQRGQDSTSIYFNGKDYRNPVYSFDEDGKLVIKPIPLDTATLAHVHYFPYLKDYDLTDSGELDGSNFFFPKQAIYLGVLKASANLLQAKISQAVQEDEDSELLGLLQGQIASIDKSMQEELQRLGMPHNLVGDGNDIN